MGRVLIHFDVPEHFVRVETFVSAALAAQQTVEALNRVYFDNRLILDVVVFAPETGSIKEYIGVKIRQLPGAAVVVWATVQVMDSSTVQDVSRELFGYTPSEMIVGAIQHTKGVIHSLTDGAEKFSPQLEKEILEEILSISASNSLAMEREKIERAKIPDQLKYELREAQSVLFEGALKDSTVRAIGFTEDDEFPIQRNQFAQRAVRPLKPEKEDEKEEWIVDRVRVRVTSPNFDKDDQLYRKWKGRLASGHSILFEISDEEFWSRLKSGEVEFTENTEIEVQLAVHVVDRRSKDRRVIRVISINDVTLAVPLSDDAIRAIVGDFSERMDHHDQDDLFGKL